MSVLLESPNKMDKEIRNKLLFKLLLKNRREIRAVVATLRLVYSFNNLLDNYIKDKYAYLPEHPRELNKEVKGLFLITKRSQLKNLGSYKAKLQEFYYVTRLLSDYFDLPLLRKPLPTILQELTSNLAKIFLYVIVDAENFKEKVRMLRKQYYF
ncbi:40868_t:CDS:1 [Gigaspora margarita]|uniref:40868_t:CDS:1 n=1 Tax=Gigaspora margarita TaxID=4874 RepID=A0ABN7UDL1_GIGMA|nr:40868_t:CDS:1 [Gigaspora margarita]